MALRCRACCNAKETLRHLGARTLALIDSRLPRREGGELQGHKGAGRLSTSQSKKSEPLLQEPVQFLDKHPGRGEIGWRTVCLWTVTQEAQD